MNEYYKKKIEVIKFLRQFFESKNCTEVFTPITRRTCSPSMKRVTTQYDNYLRNCQESYLRLMTEYYGDVFEIGPSFRPEEREDNTHGIEFVLLEAQLKNKSIDYMMELLKNIVLEYNPEAKFEIVSIYESIKTISGIDIKETGISPFIEYLKEQYPLLNFSQEFEIVNYFINKQLEPSSKERYVFFTEYPACTLSIANYRNDTNEIVNRFEFFINGIEVSNSYEYVQDINEYIYRNKIVDMYTINPIEVINAAKEHGVIIEVNKSVMKETFIHKRQNEIELTSQLIRYACKEEVNLLFGSDAHHISEMGISHDEMKMLKNICSFSLEDAINNNSDDLYAVLYKRKVKRELLYGI